MRRISKKTREQAALVCALAASNDDGKSLPEEYARHVGIEGTGTILHPAVQLVYDAWYAPSEPGQLAIELAEAEAKLRTGWTP